MKQLDYIYSDTNNLKTYMEENFKEKKLLIQLFCSEKVQGNVIAQEIHANCTNTSVNIIVSPSCPQTRLQFTVLADDTVLVSELAPMEFDFFNSGPVVIFKREPKDDCWIVTHVTSSVSQWGYEPAFFLDDEDAVKEVFHKEDMQRVRDDLTLAVKEGKNQINQQYRIYKTDGTIAWVSDYTQVIRNAQDEPVELIGYLVDITQDKKHEALYAGIINTTAEGFWLLDADLKIIDVNYSLCAMIGYRKDEMIGKSPYDFIAEQDYNLCQEQADSIDELSSRTYEITLRVKEGGEIHTLANATTMYDQFGTMRTFAFMTDITSQKKIEEDLRNRQESIENLNNSLESRIRQEVEKNREKDQMMYQQSRLASMGEMIGNIAHQWRQPLNIMALVMQDIYISDQLGNLTSKKVEESYEKSNNLLQYMSQTIDDFRNFFKQNDESAKFSIKEAVETVYNLVNTNLSYNQIECVIDVRHDSQVYGGLNEFKQVLINIINNAQEAIESNNVKSNKQIHILITQKNDNALVSIADMGGGISKGVMEKIFDPYFTTKEQTQGTGLGLYMSKQIIENSMCGSLSAKNIDNGAEFIITLPLKKCEEE